MIAKFTELVNKYRIFKKSDFKQLQVAMSLQPGDQNLSLLYHVTYTWLNKMIRYEPKRWKEPKKKS